MVSCLSASYCTGHKETIETICPPFSPNTLPKIHSDSHFLLLKAELTGVCRKYPESEPFRLKCNGVLERLSEVLKSGFLILTPKKNGGGGGRAGERREQEEGGKAEI